MNCRVAAKILALLAVGLVSTRTAPASGQVATASWSEFQIIMWQQQSPEGYTALSAVGVTAARVPSDRGGETADGVAAKTGPIIAARLGVYVENIATDFYSAYHRFFPNRPVNWRFLALKERHAADPTDPSVFVRVPSLSDNAWLTHIRQRLSSSVRSYTPYRPLFFNLADEAGIADLTAFWDFDWSPYSLARFRAWLKTQYASLAALNAEWDSTFARWDDVTPELTTTAMQRTDENYAPWSDFKAWMDVAFARAIRTGTEAVHHGGPWARAAIEGVQIPGWGGYDYSRLADTVDVMEIFNDGVSLALMHSLAPRLLLLTTSYDATPGEEHRLWNAVLNGSRGVILWDPQIEIADQASARHQVASADFTALRHGIGPLLMTSRPNRDRIAILYSPASFRMQWMLDQRAGGDAWLERQADTEDQDNALRIATRDALGTLEEKGLAPHFVTEGEIEGGGLQRAKDRLLILPEVLALSTRAAAQIVRFRQVGGRLLVIGEAGTFDEHGRRRPPSPLERPFFSDSERTIRVSVGDINALRAGVAQLTTAAGIALPMTIKSLADAAGPEIRAYRFRQGGQSVIALQQDQPDGDTQENSDIALELRRPAFACDVATHRPLGRASRFAVHVGSGIPTVIALSSSPISARCAQGL